MGTSEYDSDFVLWSEHQADALRHRANDEIDWENVAGEIASLGKKDRCELAKRIQLVLEHLIRLQASSAIDPRRVWESTISEQRHQIRMLIADSPSLQPEVTGIIAGQLPTACLFALLSLKQHGETPQVVMELLTFSETDVLGEDQSASYARV